MDLNELVATKPNDLKRWCHRVARDGFQEISTAISNGWTRQEIAAAMGLDKIQGQRLLRAYDKEKAERDQRRILQNRRIVQEYADLARVAKASGIEIAFPFPASLINLSQDGEG